MNIRIADVIEKYGIDYTTAVSLDIEGRTEISFESAMDLHGRGILLDKEQNIYTNDLPRDERRSALSEIFEFLNT